MELRCVAVAAAALSLLFLLFHWPQSSPSQVRRESPVKTRGPYVRGPCRGSGWVHLVTLQRGKDAILLNRAFYLDERGETPSIQALAIRKCLPGAPAPSLRLRRQGKPTCTFPGSPPSVLFMSPLDALSLGPGNVSHVEKDCPFHFAPGCEWNPHRVSFALPKGFALAAGDELAVLREGAAPISVAIAHTIPHEASPAFTSFHGPSSLLFLGTDQVRGSVGRLYSPALPLRRLASNSPISRDMVGHLGCLLAD